jgi:tryptophan synthase beta chain
MFLPEVENQISLSTEEIPKKWYNIIPDLPEALPPPHEPEDGTSRLELLGRIMVKTCLGQEFSTDRWIDIPKEIVELYLQAGRPRPLYRAKRLERYLKLPEDKIRLYYKREDLSPTGSHKVNTALAQAYYAAKEGFKSVSTETGAGQWGSALSYAASLVGLKCVVFWVRFAHDWKPERRVLMNLYGADVYASPSKETEYGKKLLAKDPKHAGSLGIAISEGMEYAMNHQKTVYCLGSVLNHVLMHQSIIGLEVMKQFEKVDDWPDLMVSCLGGGSNFGGFTLPIIGEVIKKKHETKFLAAQTEASPSLIKGEYKYDFADPAHHTPLLKMYSLGPEANLPNVYAEGLRYTAASPIISLLRNKGIISAVAYPTDEKQVFESARTFIQTEGFVPAPESAYGVACAIDEALKAKRMNEEKCIAFNVSGHGFLDLPAYQKVLGIK